MLIIDLSSNNAEPKWAALKRSGIEAVWLKASEGVTWRDPDFNRWRAAAGKAGLRVGAYHFARPDLHPFDPVSEAKGFCAQVVSVGRRDLRPVLDYERLSGRGGDETWIRQFNRVVSDRLKVGPLFYSYPALIESLDLAHPVGYGLWLASYGRNDGKQHPYRVPAPWKKLVAHQFSSRCRVVGCDGLVDLSRVYQSRAVLAHPVAGRV
jgi:lysozyme